MRHSLTDVLALAALLLWPAIPLFWVPVHCVPRFFRLRTGNRVTSSAIPARSWNDAPGPGPIHLGSHPQIVYSINDLIQRFADLPEDIGVHLHRKR